MSLIGRLDDFDELVQNVSGAGFERSDDIDELDYAEPPFSILVLGDKRLRFGETVSDLGLRQAALGAQSMQQGT